MGFVINARPLPIWAGLSGLGDPCPSIAPYPNLAYPGRCTNVSEADQRAAASGGGIQTGAASPVTPIDTAIAAANAAARFGLQLTPDEETQIRLAAEAQAQGSALGVPTSCRVVVNDSPGYGDLAPSRLYQALCTTPAGEQSAAQLVRGNGWAIQTGNPTISLPVATAPAAGGNAAGSAASGAASSGGGFNNDGGAAAGWPSDVFTAPSGVDVGGFSLSLPMIAGAAVLAFIAFGGKR